MEHKIHSANEAVQAIKQLRKEIVEIMLQLLVLAKSKNSKGMLSLCEMMIAKSRLLLNIWEPKLVEEAFTFIEMNRILEEPDDSVVPMSPFKKITQQLGTLDLKSPELEDFSTPMGAIPDLWPLKGAKSPCNPLRFMTKSPSSVDINAIANIQNCVKNFPRSQNFQNEHLSQSLPNSCHFDLKFSETHFDVNGEVLTAEMRDKTQESEKSFIKAQQPEEDGAKIPTNQGESFKKQNPPIEKNNNSDAFVNLYDENGCLIENTSSVLGHNGAFLDTKVKKKKRMTGIVLYYYYFLFR
jgi:inositol polyphosphate-4-phosphatase